MSVDLQFGQTMRTFTLQELRDLRSCLKSNDDRIAISVEVFLETYRNSERDPLFWVGFAEEIVKDFDYPEKHFSQKMSPSSIVFEEVKP